MANNQIKRVKYLDKQVLRRIDLADEQNYHLKMHRLHNISHHTWGIVRGLELVVNEKTGAAQVNKGIAVDIYGREVVRNQYFAINPQEFRIRNVPEGPAALNVFIRFQVVPVRSSDTRYLPDCNSDVDGSCEDRVLERSKVETKPGILNPDQRPAYNDALDDAQTSIDETKDLDLDLENDDRVSHIFLGQIVREGETADKYVYHIDSAWRPYAGLVAATLRSPDNSVELRLGGEAGPFALHLREDDAPTGSPASPLGLLSPPSPLDSPLSPLDSEDSDVSFSTAAVMALTDDNRFALRVSQAIVNGDVLLRNGSLAFRTQNKVIPDVKGQDRSIYLAKRLLTDDEQVAWVTAHTPEDATAGSVVPPSSITELRVDLGLLNDDGTSLNNMPTQFAIGAFSATDKKFKPILTVREDGVVAITGKLVTSEHETSSEPILGAEKSRSEDLIARLRKLLPTMDTANKAILLDQIEAAIRTYEG